MNNNNLKYTILFSVLLIIIIVVIIISVFKSKNYDYKLKTVTDYSTFFTVDDCINRYIGYINDGEKNKLLNVLNSEYKESYNINENNVISFVDTLNIINKIADFKSVKMYEKKISNKEHDYYVKGKLYIEEDINEPSKFWSDYYLIVKLNESNNTFYITPYDGGIFIGGNNYEK